MAQGTHPGGRPGPSILTLQIFGFSPYSIAVKVGFREAWDIPSIILPEDKSRGPETSPGPTGSQGELASGPTDFVNDLTGKGKEIAFALRDIERGFA